MDGEATGRPGRADLLILSGWIVAIALIRAGTIQDTDPYWQIRAGQEVLDGSPLARPDSWSWDPVPGLFFPNSPGWNVVLALSWRGAGFWGLFAVTGISIIGCLGITALLARRLGAGPLPTTAAIIATSLLALPMLSPRAGLGAQALFMLAMAAAAWWSPRARHRSPIPNAAVVAAAGLVFSLVGNWVHLSWATLAIATALAWSVMWFLSSAISLRRATAMSAAGAAGLAVGVLLGPYGTGVVARSAVVLAACQGLMLEWTGALHPDMRSRWLVPTVLALAVGVGGLAWAGRSLVRGRSSDRRVPVVAALCVVAAPAAAAGVVAVRFTGVALLTLTPVVALGLSVAMSRLHLSLLPAAESDSALRVRARDWTSLPFWRVIMTITLVVLSPLVLVLAWPHGQPPSAAVNAEIPAGCHLFTRSDEAAAVILTRPDVPVWFDSRADYWGRPRLELMNDYLFHPDAARLVPTGTTCILLPDADRDPSIAVLVSMVDADADWARAAEQDGYVLWLPRSTDVPPLS
jgi:hypothetical protein